MLHRAIVIVVGTLLAASLCAGQTDHPLTPRWTHDVHAGVEWCEPASLGGTSYLVCCDKEATLIFLELTEGASFAALSDVPEPGLRWAGCSDARCYAFSPRYAYAFAAPARGEANQAPGGLCWRQRMAPIERIEGDPEFAARLLAAAATPAGLLVVRSDGWIAELSGVAGELRWKHHLGALDRCDLEVCGPAACVIAKRGAELLAVFVDLQHPDAEPAVLRLDEPPPLRSALLRDGLALVWPGRFALLRPGRPPAFHEFALGETATAAGIQFCTWPSDCGDPRAAAREPLLLSLCADCPIPRVYDMKSGRRLDRKRSTSQPSLPCGGRLVVEGAHSLQFAGSRCIVRRAATSEFVADLEVCEARSETAAVRGDCVYALFVNEADGQARLLREEIHRGNAPFSQTREPLGSSHFCFDPASRLWQARWAERTLILVEADRIRAYTLP